MKFLSTGWSQLLSHSNQSNLLRTIKQYLAPDAEGIRAELYKLLVYTPGDKFKAHKDTIRGNNHFASLVMFLPSWYEGGDLVVRSALSEKNFNFSLSNPTQADQLLQCHWVAFYTDCEHEIPAVTSGYRVTLTYNLYFEGSRIPMQLTGYNSRIIQAMCESYLRQAPTNQVTHLGFVLEHVYSRATLSLDQLKGRDRNLYHVLSNKKFRFELMPVDVKLEVRYVSNQYKGDSDPDEGGVTEDWESRRFLK